MEKYIQQLTEDIRACKQNIPPKPYIKVTEGMECMRYAIEWENAASKPMKEWLGIDTSMFPGEEKLSDSQIQSLVKEMTELWQAFNFYPDLPEGLPGRIAYKLMVDHLDEPVAWVSEGETHIEFCHYDPAECPFPKEFCYCREFSGEDEMDGNPEDTDHQASLNPATENAESIQRVLKFIKKIEEEDYYKYEEFTKADTYVNQLLNEFSQAAKKATSIYNQQDTAEEQTLFHALTIKSAPYVTLQELTDIPQESLPDHIDIHNWYVCKLLVGILKLLNAYKIQILYPEGVPPEILYQEFIDQWDSAYVQHIPDSGFDLDFCTGDEMDCPFSLYCNCKEEVRKQLEEDERQQREVDNKNKHNEDNPFDDPDDWDELPF